MDTTAELRTAIVALREQDEAVALELRALHTEHAALRAENTSLVAENASLRAATVTA